MPENLQNPSQEELARDDANAWVARFAPLVLEQDALTAPQVRDNLELLAALKAEAPDVKRRLLAYDADVDATLRSTLERAIGQLDSIDTDLRKRLARLAPGDPEGVADLDKLNQRLEERLAKQEIGVPTDVPEILEMKTCGPNIAAAAFMGVFGFGWTSFTALHASFMIGGMFKAFGWAALALLGFYSIFFLVGFGMLYAALNGFSSEFIELNGRELTVRRKLGGWVREKRYTLAPDCKPTIEMVARTNNNSSVPNRAVVLIDSEGRQIQLATGASEWQRQQVVEKVGAYLAAQS